MTRDQYGQPQRMPIICPWCRQVFPFDAYKAHRLLLAEAPEGFVCLEPAAVQED